MTTQTSSSFSSQSQDVSMTLQEFLAQFPNHDDAIDFVFACHKQGRVEVSMNTLPHYEYNALANPPRFIAYSNYAPNVHSYGVRIIRWYEDDDCRSDAIVRFEHSDPNAWAFYHRHFESELDGVTEESEMHWQDNTQSHKLREVQALTLQSYWNERRIQRTRRYMVENNDTLNDKQFEQNCIDIATMRDLNRKAQQRIEQLGF